MSNNDYELQISLKTAGGTLINVPATSPDEARAKMEHVQALAPVIAATEGLLNGNSAAAAVAAPPQEQPAQQQQGWGAPPQAGQQPPPQQPPAAAAPGGQTCPHGARVYKTGVGKSNNKPWAAWMCPAPKGTPGQCDPIWDGNYGK